MRTAFFLLLVALTLPAAAQEEGQPHVTSDAPTQPAASAADPVADVPALPPGSGRSGGPVFTDSPAVASDMPAPTDLANLVRVAHPVVQAVMALLALAGFAALTILVHKLAEFALANRRLGRVLATVAQAADLPEAPVGLRGPGAEMLRATLAELELTRAEPALLPGTAERTRACLDRIETAAVQSLRMGTGILASIGALAPFIGLFGTVFGIMNSFLAIAGTKTTNLAVVAPGIAEALLATAIGLVAAIPAVLVYNLLSRRLVSHRHRLGDLATALSVLQSRALDRLAAHNASAG